MVQNRTIRKHAPSVLPGDRRVQPVGKREPSHRARPRAGIRASANPVLKAERGDRRIAAMICADSLKIKGDERDE